MSSSALAQGLTVSAVPVWLIVLALVVAAALIAYAMLGLPGRGVTHRRDDEESALATLFEIQSADRGLSTHANGVLTLSIIAAGGARRGGSGASGCPPGVWSRSSCSW